MTGLHVDNTIVHKVLPAHFANLREVIYSLISGQVLVVFASVCRIRPHDTPGLVPVSEDLFETIVLEGAAHQLHVAAIAELEEVSRILNLLTPGHDSEFEILGIAL